MNTVYLHLGSNKNERLKQILEAFKRIEDSIGPIEEISGFYKTEAWGNTAQADFINVALKVITPLDPEELMLTILNVEENMGRTRTEKWVSRIIDIDVIFFNALTLKTELIEVPHPLMEQRKFVLLPMLEIASNLIHPVLNKRIKELAISCTDQSKVVLL